jgi:aldehyde dehydrogenase (NAD+)
MLERTDERELEERDVVRGGGAADEAEVLAARQRRFVATGKPRDVLFRLQQLKKLHAALRASEAELLAALAADMGKPAFEAYATELGLVFAEIDFATANLKAWAKPETVPTPLALMPAQSRVLRGGVGSVLVIGAWNYPLQLVLIPAVAAIAAGCCVVVKPSELAPHAAAALGRVIERTFSEDYFAVVEGGVEKATCLLRQPWGHVFFTGSSAVGRVVLKAAAEHLTPVTLELGGKSPCLVDKAVDLPSAVRRILWGKLVNCGQTCVAPDYVLVPKSLRAEMTRLLAVQARAFYGDDPSSSPDYGRIVNAKHFARLEGLLDGARILSGGRRDAATRYFEPTILEAPPGHPLLTEEIFGPLLPLVGYESLDEALAFVAARPDPLAFYLFTSDAKVEARVLESVRAGSIGVNQTLGQVASPHLPFGGVGASGMGAYHGRYGYETFSHRTAVLRASSLIDVPLRYPPYAKDGGRLGLLRKLLG